jgi:hypothetical protein
MLRIVTQILSSALGTECFYPMETPSKNDNQMTGAAINKAKSHSVNYCDLLALHSPDRQIPEAADKQ